MEKVNCRQVFWDRGRVTKAVTKALKKLDETFKTTIHSHDFSDAMLKSDMSNESVS